MPIPDSLMAVEIAAIVVLICYLLFRTKNPGESRVKHALFMLSPGITDCNFL
jgi:hypothetical protein